ncbi:hypothetical protein [Microbacterium sp. A93]|uniref:hypothetical protein n=1 Tax=Microbacterium sp. A93 TaxID=3450716 RepID=UPI003F42BA2E
MNEQLQSDLVSADPISDIEDATLSVLVQQMARAARKSGTTDSVISPWWKRRRAFIPLTIAGVVALTGAAVLIPLSLGVNGTNVELDAEIPIVYTTDTGVSVTCRYGIYFGEPAERTDADEQLADFVKNHDWTGIGQRIYEEAVANPFVPGPNDDWEVDTQELRDIASFNQATDLIWEEIPKKLAQEVQSSSGTMDCKGQLR